MSSDTTIILWVLGGGFGLMSVMWFFLNKRIDKIEEKMDFKFEKVEVKLNSLDGRLIAIETILRMKECCMIQDDRNMKKAE